MKNFITETKEALINQVKNNQVVPMTVYNLARNVSTKDLRVFWNEFSLKEEAAGTEKLEIIKNCILGTEWDSTELGYFNECTIFGEGGVINGYKCLYIQTKIGDKEDAEFYVFKEKEMSVNPDGELTVTYNETSHICDLNNTK
jgi:hypothetical protein